MLSAVDTTTSDWRVGHVVDADPPWAHPHLGLTLVDGADPPLAPNVVRG